MPKKVKKKPVSPSDEDVRTKYLGSGFILKKSVSVERAKAEHQALEAARSKAAVAKIEDADKATAQETAEEPTIDNP